MTSHHRFRSGVVYSLAALLALALLVTAGAATAGHVRVATAVSGSWAATGGDIVEQRQLGSATYLRQLGSSSFQGDLVGATTFDLRLVLRADFSSFGWATEAFQGKLGGRSGTLSMLERVTGGVDGSVPDRCGRARRHRRAAKREGNNHIRLAVVHSGDL